ncbi:AraC family transcriptional regulator [Cohnella silvisoli]|uniref:AraC family transcriptional regulator n=1 Tax=Cohnella silvisoli TaxID=2873699 RepID=A0ABV1KL97_9BACL|nr:AraC family transcriptional regulator [Cohnella silvisoli]MCD9020756.1 AraC family transcriptional regulator [Cohnella silvisoli]
MTNANIEEKRFTGGISQHPFACKSFDTEGRGYHCPAHWHTHLEMLYMTRGRGTFHAGGSTYAAGKGDLLLINANEVHAVDIRPEDDAEYLILSVVPEVVYHTGSTIFEAKYIFPFMLGNRQHKRHFKADDLEETPVPALLMDIHREYSVQQYGFELALRSAFTSVFLWMLRYWIRQEPSQAGFPSFSASSLDNVKPILEHLEHGFKENLTASDAAELCGMSYSHFARCFKQITGHSFVQYLHFRRISEAEKLLLTTSWSVTRVAMECGFSHTSYFIRHFRAHKGLSPKQFVQRVKGNINPVPLPTLPPLIV